MSRLASAGRWLGHAVRGDIMVVRVGLHLLVLLGLLLSLGVAQVAEGYFTRGVAAGADMEPIPDTAVNPMAINTFLNEEVDPEKVERSLDMIAEAGFGYIRQIFGWYEIEPEQDVYINRFGESTWEKYDRIVEMANERGIEIIARLEKPPRWARAGQPNLEQFPDGPPDRVQDWIDFVETVVSRYRGEVKYFQLWNEPNLEGEWGGQPIDPRAYVDLLQAGYEAAKRANPNAVILLAGLAPTEQTGPENLSDLLFLERVYDYGGGKYFDIATAMVYGYGYSPYDRRVDFARNNFSRVIQMREIMVENGDADKPIWAVEYGWVSLPEDWQGNPSPWGEPVSEEQQAEYLVEGYLRAQKEWPWMGVMAVWAFRWVRPPDHPDEVGNPTRGFALVEYDFTPQPAYTALANAAPRIQRLGTGAYEATSYVHQQVSSGRPVSMPVIGERLDVVVDTGNGGYIDVVIDGEDYPRVELESGKTVQKTVVADLSDGPHDVTAWLLSEPTDNPPILQEFVVTRSPVSSWIYPWIDGALLLAIAVVVASLVWSIWDWREPKEVFDE